MQVDSYRFLIPRHGDAHDAAGDCGIRIRGSILLSQAVVRWLAGTVIFALVLALPFDSSAQSSAPPAEAESVWTRDNLGGDWSGLRSGLAQHGVQYDFWITAFYQGLFAGDGDDDFDFGGRVDLLINGSTEKLGLWQGGGLHAHLTYSGGSLQGFRGGALWPVNTSVELPLGTKDELVATSLYVSQRVGESTRLMLGKINAIDLLASHPFFGGWGIDRFWNIAFVAPLSGVVSPVIMGGILSHSFSPYALTLMVFDPNDQTTNYSPGDLFADGVNTSLGLSWSGAIDGRKSGAGITATYSTAEGTDYTTIGLPAGAETTTKQGSYNVAVEVSHLIFESTQSPDKGLGMYAKAAIADGNPNPYTRDVHRRACGPRHRAGAATRLLRRRLFRLRLQRPAPGCRRGDWELHGRAGRRSLLQRCRHALAARDRRPAVDQSRERRERVDVGGRPAGKSCVLTDRRPAFERRSSIRLSAPLRVQRIKGRNLCSRRFNFSGLNPRARAPIPDSAPLGSVAAKQAPIAARRQLHSPSQR
jgi:porin